MALDLKYPLQDLLSSVTNGDITQPQLSELNRVCQRVATTYIRRRIAAGKINPSFLGLSDSDISLDCVAELFSPSPDGRFVEFIDYFDGNSIDIHNTPERTLLLHIRRLVFFVCNDNIFRMYGEADPALSRIIRNIKLGIKRSKSIRLVMKFDEQMIVRPSYPDGHHMQPMTYDEVQSLVDGNLDVRTGIPGVLEGVSRILLDPASSGRSIPLTSLACSVRESFIRLNINDAAVDEDPMFVDDIRTIIREACHHVASRAGSKYLVNGKLSHTVLQGYMTGIINLLEAEFLGRTEGAVNYFDFISDAVPGLTREEYTRSHRTVFEYLVKLSKTRACRDLRNL